MNISRLAEQLKMTPKDLLILLPRLGFAIGARAQKVDDRQVNRIVSAIKRHQKLEALKNREQHIKEVRGKERGEAGAERTVSLPHTIIVKDLAEALGFSIQKVMAEMMKNGIMASLNERIDFETASIISEDLGYSVVEEDAEKEATHETTKKEMLDSLLEARHATTTRPPVVVVMGHVDHGKTKLLDTIRKTNVMAKESGGITQHIGAYQAEATLQGEKRLITFLDTPGHEAFKTMRSRGGQIADVGILVVAADDGLKPQTLESIAIMQKENLPFVVAINKIDKEAADIERVKKELSEINLIPEDWGGKTVCVPISALKGDGIPELLEMTLLVTDLAELKADPEGSAIGTVIESHIDKGEGPVATVLVQAGTLKPNDLLIAGPATGKIKALKSWHNDDIKAATPGMPVKILGLKQLPAVGEIVTVVNDRKLYNERLKEQQKIAYVTKRDSVAKTAPDANEETTAVSLNVIIRADVLGSLEAIEEALGKLASPDGYVRVIKKGLGFVTEADVLTAQATSATIISFHLKENRAITSLADERKVAILYYDVIYHVLEEMKKRLTAIKPHQTVREIIGKLNILAVFRVKGKTTVCGGKVVDGLARREAKIKVLSPTGELKAIGEIANLQSNRENVNEVAKGAEAGLELTVEPVIAVGDMLEFFTEK